MQERSSPRPSEEFIKELKIEVEQDCWTHVFYTTKRPICGRFADPGFLFCFFLLFDDGTQTCVCGTLLIVTCPTIA